MSFRSNTIRRLMTRVIDCVEPAVVKYRSVTKVMFICSHCGLVRRHHPNNYSGTRPPQDFTKRPRNLERCPKDSSSMFTPQTHGEKTLLSRIVNPTNKKQDRDGRKCSSTAVRSLLSNRPRAKATFTLTRVLSFVRLLFYPLSARRQKLQGHGSQIRRCVARGVLCPVVW